MVGLGCAGGVFRRYLRAGQAGYPGGSWAKPTLSVSAGVYPNLGGIAGSCYYESTIENCWANAAGYSSVISIRAGGITGRQAGAVSNCFVLGAEKLGCENAIVFASWDPKIVTGCIDLTSSTQAIRDSFYQSCGWDFAEIWDQSGTYPILRGCDQAAQRLAQ